MLEMLETLLLWGNRWNWRIGVEVVVKDKQKLGRFMLLILLGAGAGVAAAVAAGTVASNHRSVAPIVVTRQPMLATPLGRAAITLFLLIWSGFWFTGAFFMLFRPDFWVRWSNWGNRWFGLELIVVDQRKLARYCRWMGIFFILIGAAVIAGTLSVESIYK